MIPKVIHYCWFGQGKMGVLHRRCMESWQRLCPDYEIKLWNESNSDIDNAYCQAAIARRKWAFVSDWVRFDVLAREGGFYMDTDLELVRNLDPLLEHRVCVASRESRRSIGTAFLASPAGDTVMQAARRLMLDDLSRRKVFATSPEVLKKAIADCSPSDSVILDRSSFFPFNPYERDNPDNARQLMVSDLTPDTYGVHHFRLGEVSWSDSPSRRAALRLMKMLHITPHWHTSYEPW